MPRYALKIEYHGAPFRGWQRQKEHPSVQQTVEEALLKIDPTNKGIAAAGRTDAGVHATAQVAHCDLAREWDAFRLAEALNYHLKPHPVAIVNAAPVDDDFHARFSALERRYLFRLVSRRAPMTFEAGNVWQVAHPLDRDAMQEGAQYLLGRHDFTTFRSTICQANSPLRTLDELCVEEIPLEDATEYRFYVRARAFLHNQVRSFVGTLERVGAGSWAPQDVKKALEARDRAACGPVCPPQGLYLSGVKYEPDPFEGRVAGALVETKDRLA
ncbi:tRNA pseudouridine(38-40) synthase TruA [Falsihalocynthiibacter sp. SS001]|uniref:tRNA pseudouridine(38-40) synthase TruA n=1 Tax=Falsihalocynthiibacter sp. SS001 TaxID=3349698 RepID=UPI0036D37BC1